MPSAFKTGLVVIQRDYQFFQCISAFLLISPSNNVKEGVLSAFLPPVGRRSFRSRKMNVFLYSEQLCFEIISLVTNNEILKRLFHFMSI